jgi:serine/threonine-protein kinase
MFTTTTIHNLNATLTHGRNRPEIVENELLARYDALLAAKRLSWTFHYHVKKRLGSGGQGIVYLTDQLGADGFTLPVALKIFTPERYGDARAYDDAMTRIAQVSAHVAQIQQDNLLDVRNFVDRDRIRMMVMEWVDGFDLRQMLCNETFQRIQGRVSQKRWEYINNVIATRGKEQARFKPGVAVSIVRQCLAALAALHRQNIVHGDIKPSNVMLKRTGNAKIIDIGSAFELDHPPPTRTCTPTYAAPEVLDGRENTPRSDLASLGYVLVEMLSGRQPFANMNSYGELLEAKRTLPQRLSQLLPAEVLCNELLMNFCRGLIAPDPQMRFPDAEAATLVKEGAAAFLRQLVKGDMSSEYENEIRLLIEELKDLAESADPQPSRGLGDATP